jgi:omega-amidase
MDDLKIALIQSDLYWEDARRNLEQFGSLLGSMKEPCDLVVLPEMFSTGFSMNPERCAEPVDGPAMQFMRTKAMELDCCIMGSILTEEDGVYYNRLVSMRPNGTCEHYDKRHLFRLSREYMVIRGGARKIIVKVRGWRILPLICYDLRFPVWSRNRWMNGSFEYDLLVYPANWPASRANVWKTLLPARAIENIAYVAGVNRIGKDGEGTAHEGESMIIGPKGNILACGDKMNPSVLTATLSGEDLQQFRESFNIGSDWDHFILEI